MGQTRHVAHEPDVETFEARAKSYEQGWRGRLHHEIADRTAELALLVHPEPRHVLDVGCGTGYLLRTIAGRCSDAERLNGIDRARSMIEAATSSTGDDRVRFAVGPAEQLPFSHEEFDLVVTTTSFDHWSNQETGLLECARVLRPRGHLIVVDQFSLLLAPTLVAGRRGKARTKGRVTALLRSAGFPSVTWHNLYAMIIRAATAVA
jgi:ubiquinone/menaquinone biosynthesis C-methylase UbiE